MKTWHWQAFFMVLIIFMMASMFYLRPKLVTFNPDKLYQPFVLQLSQHQLSDEKIFKKTQEFRKNLNLSLAEYAKKHHVVILEQKQVLAGGQDISNEILRLISKRVQK